MPGDYSRRIFDPRKHYAGVLMQQGRVQLDADANAQVALQLYRTHTESTDAVGGSGVPKRKGGFKVAAAPGGFDLTVSPGRMYVDGLLCELDVPATYTQQPHFPNPDFTVPASSPAGGSRRLNAPDGPYLVYLDAWLREVTARDDRLIREVALGGPDTTARLQTVYQVRLMPLSAASPLSPIGCDTPFADVDGSTGLSTGMLNARTQPPQDPDNPCLLPPTAGYTRLENQLYRVEVHTGGPRGVATFKWSRDNASVETSIEQIAGNILTVADVGRDDVLGFAGQQWVEVLDEESSLKGLPNALAQIDKVDPGKREITLKTSAAAFSGRSGLKLRRWDQSGPTAAAAGVNASLANWIDLEGGIQVMFSTSGDFRSGDYWLIPARTATGEIEWPPYDIPNTSPQPQPPRGVRHHYARLAIADVIGGTISIREDCRKPFPSLTEICAEDICFDNETCSLEGAETVQEAIDRLCQERDLRFHKKHLHGWGIVCGLQVNCGPGSHVVTVRDGYAITCEGDDIRVETDQTLDVFDLIASDIGFPASSPLTSPVGVPDTDVSLVLDSNPASTRRFRVEAYKPKKHDPKSLLKGTLLMDFFEDCIQSLLEFVKTEFTVPPGEANVPVGPTQKRVTTFLNLLIQLVNKQNGAFVFLSGEKAQAGPNFEDTILRNFYTKLRDKLQSHTFCAMFDGARPFPEYPYTAPGITTIFGKGSKTRVRIAPGSTVGYTVGGGTTINVFDLEKGEMIEELAFPGGPGAVVQDVAVSRDGRQLYASALINNRDTMFAVADITGNGQVHTFRAPTLICDQLLVTLGTSAAFDSVYAIGKGQDPGLYVINPQNVDPNIKPTYPFNAVGHLAFDADGREAFATKSSGASPTNSYDRVLRLPLDGVVQNPPEFMLQFNNQQLKGTDDIAFATMPAARQLYVVVDPPPQQTTKHVLVYNTDVPANPLVLRDLQQTTTIRLAQNTATDRMMVAYEDIYRVGMLNADDVVMDEFVPVQIGPISIAMAPDQAHVYVLNYWSNTLSVVRAEMFSPGKTLPLPPLVAYRAGVLNAFADLLGGLLQYLKDCFCDHLLVDCPTCEDNDKLYLASISIRNNKVYKVCNFSQRKYVHSFPTWEYWLSAVPVLPFIRTAIEEICCAALPGLFGRFTAPTPAPPVNTTIAPKNTIDSGPARNAATKLRESDFKRTALEQKGKLKVGKKAVLDPIWNPPQESIRTTPEITHTDVSGQTLADARRRLEDAHVEVVHEEEYDPRKAGPNLGRYITSPARLREGDRVTLITREGKVLFYARAPEPSPDVAALRNEVAANKAAVDQTAPRLTDLQAKLDASNNEALQLRQQMNRLEADLLATRQTHQTELRARDERIAELQNAVRDVQSSAQTMRDIQNRVERLERRPPG